MLDSNVLIDIVREPDGAVAAKFESKDLDGVFISPIVSGELLFGIRERPDARSNPGMRFLLGGLRIDRLEPPVDAHYGKIRLDLMRSGKSLSANDYWIAAHAMVREATLVTGDRAFHDAGIEGLKLEDWRVE